MISSHWTDAFGGHRLLSTEMERVYTTERSFGVIQYSSLVLERPKVIPVAAARRLIFLKACWREIMLKWNEFQAFDCMKSLTYGRVMPVGIVKWKSAK